MSTSFLTSIDDDLSRAHSLLEMEFARSYPHHSSTSPSSSHMNPFILLNKMRNLQTQIPDFRDQLLDTHQQKLELVKLIRSDLVELHDHAAFLGRHPPPGSNADDYTRLVENLEQTKRKQDMSVKYFLQFNNAVSREMGSLDESKIDMSIFKAAMLLAGLSKAEDKSAEDVER